ncbi:MAG: DUF4345 family protein [Cyclobacteriaceae bacterium]|jgi:hypothetical protein|uniref:DUF4345 family protein n=1 Tax=Algoriphagus marincola TaxID=264027 RepID=A0ABS7N8F0_9BACT|nr:DUF4345 family protein [Algoriphagus marincola]MBY5952603.1 DUF4345 family protein [Algoriphagus marincola]MCR9082638.1 DUF4345 family protein [Cyclobacteriaceae bacterium]
MLLFIRIFLVLYGLIAAATGFMGATAKYNSAATDPMTDNNHRYVAAIWMATSLAFFYVAWNPSETALFRFLMVAVFIGGLVRAAALVNYPATPFLIFLILIELIPTALMLWFQAKLLNSGSL